jgi:hypothetical protein
MATDDGLSLQDSLRKRILEDKYNFKFDDCSKEDLIKIILQSSLRSDLLESTLEESLLNFSNVTFDVNIPEQEKPSLGLFANLLVQHLQASHYTIFKQGKPYQSSDIASQILAESDEGIEWINYALSGAIQFLQENQLREFSSEDVNLVDALVTSKTFSISIATKVLKQLVDRLSSSAFKSNQTISNSTFTDNKAFMKLLEALYFTGYPLEDN